MINKFSILILFVILLLTGCKYKDVFKTFQYSNKWEISYPSYLNKTRYVYPGAEFQVKNGYRDTYIFLREASSNITQAAFLDSVSTNLRSSLVDPKIEEDTIYTLNEVKFATHYITGLLQDKRMFYLISIIDSGDELYHFGGWMFNTKRSLWQKDFEKTLLSWKKTQK